MVVPNPGVGSGAVAESARSMRKLLVFQHSAREPLGVLDPMLRRAGFRIRYINFSRQPEIRPDVSRYNGLVILGGPMNVDQQDRYPHLTTEIEAIREALARDIPILGICLGAQLLAAALGANVRPNHVREIGWYRLHPTADAGQDALCRHLEGDPHVFQWHAYTFDLPPGAVHLASTPTCPNQAFRYGDRAYGLQFHLEADETLIQRWLHVPEYRSEAEAAGPAHHLERILSDTHSHAAGALGLSQRVFGEFIELLGWRRRVRLGSL
jgi:GMP synthase (glutamine-hydrolysing)